MLILSQQRIACKVLTVSISGVVFNQVNSVRYLGLIIDSTLSWSLHITNIVSRVQLRISSMLRFGTLPPVVLCLLYVLPLFDYCDVVWISTTAKLTLCLKESIVNL